MDSKSVCNQGWIDTEEESVCNARHARDEAQVVGVLDVEGAKLSYAENARREGEAPETAHVQLLHEHVRAHTAEQAPYEAAE